MAERYAIEGGRSGKARLDVLARLRAPSTSALLDRVGVAEGARCLDVGCGGGHVSLELARRVGEHGFVVGIDLDATVLDFARADAAAAGIRNVEFRCDDGTQLGRPSYDVVYSRFLLSHIEDTTAVLAAMASALRRGGVLIAEDVDFSGCFCYPPCDAYDRYVALYRETIRRRGGNADLGPRLPSQFHSVGIRQIEVAVIQSCGLEGDAKLIMPLTLERIADAAVSEGLATARDIEQMITELYDYYADPTTLMGTPRIVQTWGAAP
jgi:SAM-dependent methyltransferase